MLVKNDQTKFIPLQNLALIYLKIYQLVISISHSLFPTFIYKYPL